MLARTLTSRGQTTIPKTIREALQLHPGDRVEFILEDDQVVLRREGGDLPELDGMIDRSDRESAFVEEMDEAIERAAARDKQKRPLVTGLDTNDLVHYITRDDPDQYQAAKSFLVSNCTQEEPGYGNVIVLCELAWVLASVYDATKEELTEGLDQLLRTRQLQIERRVQVRLALEQYKRSAAGFPDCLLGQLNQH